MIGLDTNVLARYVLDDNPHWSPIVTRFLDTQLSPQRLGYINPVTLVEFAWTLRRKPGYDRAKLAEFIESLLASDSILLGEAAAVDRALAAFREGGAGFADYLIAQLNEAPGASPTVIIDRGAAKRPPFVPLSEKV